MRGGGCLSFSRGFLGIASACILVLSTPAAAEGCEALPVTAQNLLQWSLRASTELNSTLNAFEWEKKIAGLQRSRGQDMEEDPSMTAAAVASLVTNLVVCFVCLGLFSILRERYPLVYAGNVADGVLADPGSGKLANRDDMRRCRPPMPDGDTSSEVKATTRKITRLVKEGQFGDAWPLFQAMDPKGVVEYNVGLNICARAGWLNEAEALWEEMSQDVKNVVTYSTMIKVYGSMKRVHDAEKLFEEMKFKAVTPNIITYNTMIQAYGMTSVADKARSTFESIPEAVLEEAGSCNKEASYATLMFAYARRGDYASTRELFMDMTSKGIPPSRSHFNALIISCAKDGLAETARAVFEMLPHYDILPELDTWTSLMSCHRKDLEQCKRILDEMLQAGVSPSGMTYQELLNAHVLAGDGPGARELLEDMSKFGLWADTRVTQRLISEAARLP
eukprot:s464_g12.t1